ncbi:heavy-metal-associated domain-containing protein [Reinekea sp.]|jgi:copper chaperone|uniref:heavy-metal-associated domain-containing protein n=1 Tax=Reinekea sp. TaxID=1970455 RepID=UPI00398983DA
MISIKIEGATCQGCVKSIKNAIGQVAGVNSVAFDLETKIAKVEGSVSLDTLNDAVEGAGFDVVESNSD